MAVMQGKQAGWYNFAVTIIIELHILGHWFCTSGQAVEFVTADALVHQHMLKLCQPSTICKVSHDVTSCHVFWLFRT